MALILLQPGSNPLGQFDALDAQLTSFKGGEVCTWGSVSVTGTDKAAFDSFDGYGGTTSHLRPVVTLTLASTSAPLFLADDGIAGYGTLFGSVVGGTVGQVSTGGTVLGPHTATGSGKITLWDKPGLYGVTLDACDATTGGLLPSNPLCVPGVALYATTLGLITLSANKGSGPTNAIGHFASFDTNGSLVTTPQSLVAALNSPSGSVSSTLPRSFTMATFYFNGAGTNG